MLPSLHRRLLLLPLLPSPSSSRLCKHITHRLFSSSSSTTSHDANSSTTTSSSLASARQQQDDAITPDPVPQSIYQGVYYRRNPRCWTATLKLKHKTVFYKSFLPEEEKEAALAVDEATRQHLNENVLTNFHEPTGIFLDPKNAFSPLPPLSLSSSPTSQSSSCLLTQNMTRGITYVPEMNKYKAVIKHKNRPILLGFYDNELEALVAINDRLGLLPPDGEGGLKRAPRQSKYLGVSWDRYHERWVVRLKFGGKYVLSQAFRDELEDEAAHVYDSFARKYYGPDALTNFEDGVFLDPKNRVVRRVPSGNSGEPSSASTSAGAIDYRGVYWSRKMSMWRANIRVRCRQYSLGYFLDPQQAALSYDAAARRHHGKRAKCNFDEEGKRTNVRIQFGNSASAKTKYTLVNPEGGETVTTDK